MSDRRSLGAGYDDDRQTAPRNQRLEAFAVGLFEDFGGMQGTVPLTIGKKNGSLSVPKA